LNAVAYTILMSLLVRNEGPDSPLARAMGRDIKGKVSLAFYAVALGLAFVQPIASVALYVLVAALWFIPDRRVERAIKTS
jgi:hypothetical protein